MSRLESAFIVLLFYAGWFGSVFFAQTERSWMALSFPLVLITYLVVKKSLNPKAFLVAGLISLFGVVFDSILMVSDLVYVVGHSGWIVPLWLVAIWLLFSHSMIKLGAALRLPLWLAAALGLIMGPMSYKAGELFNVLYFATPFTFWIYALFWAILFPLVLNLSKRFA